MENLNIVPTQIEIAEAIHSMAYGSKEKETVRRLAFQHDYLTSAANYIKGIYFKIAALEGTIGNASREELLEILKDLNRMVNR